MKITKTLPLLVASFLTAQAVTAQNWTSITSPVTTNLILYDIDFPAAQNDTGYTGGANVTYNGKGTLLKTVDQGNSWSVVWSSTVNGTGISALCFLNVDTGFAGTQGGNLMKTTDGGVTWTSTDFDPSSSQGMVNDLKFHDQNNGVLSTSYNGVYHTSDGGATWVPATTGPTNVIYSFCYVDATTLFACGGSQSIFKSTDGGATWTNSHSSPSTDLALGIDFVDANNGMVTSEDGAYFQTTDGGATWTPGTIAGQSGLMRGVVMLDTDDIFVCATPGQVFRTIDGGATWTDDSGLNFNPSYYAILFTPNGTGFVCGSGSTGGTIMRRAPLTTAMADLKTSDAAFKTWPNPVSGTLNLEFNTPRSGRVDITVVNSLGEVVLRKQVAPNNAGITRDELDLARYAAGLYTVNVTLDGTLIGSRNISIAGR